MLGMLSSVSIGKQSSFTDPTTLARRLLSVYSVTGGQSDGFEVDPILGGGLNNGFDPAAPAPGIEDHKWTVKVPLDGEQFGWWLAAFFGTEAAPTGTTPNYVHKWVSGATPPIIFAEHTLKPGMLKQQFGMLGESLTIDLDAERGGFGQAEMTFVGLKDGSATSAMPGAVAAVTDLASRGAQKLTNVIYNGVSGGYIIGGKFTYARKLKRHRSADGSGLPYAVEQDGVATLSGSVRTRLETSTISDDGIAQTERTLEIQLLKSATRGLKFQMGHMRVNRTPANVEGPDGVEQTFDFQAWQTTVDPALTVLALNSLATQALT